MNKYKKLFNNSLIFTLGNFGSKFLTVILVPLYTYSLSTIEYGTSDLIVTTVNLLAPILCLNIFDAALRFSMDENLKKEKVFSNTVFVLFISFILSGIIGILTKLLTNIDTIIIQYTIIISFFQSVQITLAQYARGIGKSSLYAISGVLLTFIIGLSNIILLLHFDLGINGYMWSIIIGNIVVILYLSVVLRVGKLFKISNIDFSLVKLMFFYSLPLIPNGVMWWALNATSRYFVLFFIGASGNGLLAVANKIPTLISMLGTIFTQAWQLSAIEEYDSDDKSTFYSDVFKYFSMFLFIGVSIMLVIIKPLLKVAINPEFFESWRLVPFLLMAVIYQSFGGFLGTNYIAAKKTTGVLTSSIIAAVISLILNAILIPFIGLNGVGIGTMTGFIVMFFIRYYDTKKFVDMQLNWCNFIINNILILLQILVLLIVKNNYLYYLQIIIFLAINFLNLELWKFIINILKKIIVKKK